MTRSEINGCNWSRVVMCVIVTWLVAGGIADALAGDPLRDHDITADDYFTIGVITNCAMSPDGKYAAYTESRWEPPNEKRNLDLWIVEVATRQVRRLTFDPAVDASPQWSPDNQWIYFTSSRKRAGEDKPPYNGKKQVWRIGTTGGRPFAVTRVEDGIMGYDLSKDGQTLYYTVSQEAVDDEWKDLRKEYKSLEYGHGVVEFTQLWKLDLIHWHSEKLVDEKRVIRSFAVSPGENRIAMISTPNDLLISNEGRSRVDVYTVADKAVTALPDELWRNQAPSPYGWISSPAWSHDGNSLAFEVDFDGYPAEIFVAHWLAAQSPGDAVVIHKLRRPDEVSVSSGHLQWRGTSQDLCFVAEGHARARVHCITDIGNKTQGPARELTLGDVAVGTFSISGGGETLAAVLSTVTHPPDVFLFSANRPGSEHKRLTRVNPQVDTWKLPSIELTTWVAPDGVEVEGILELPPDYTPGTKLPMVVELHGGPTSASLLRMRFWIYGRVLMAARGYALLSPNYRGSTGYGDKFLTDLIGHKNDRDVTDVLAGVDAMIERGIADPDRLGVMGWSNGGYLTNCLITRTRRFKAASSGAGVLEVSMQWGMEDTPGHVINFQQGFPWNRTDAMHAASPLYELDKVVTPTIVHVGGKDPRCPPGHSRALYRALHEYLDVPTELIVYPTQGHCPMTYTTRKAKMVWDLAWFDRYLPLDEPEVKQAQQD
ncbi:MAG: S9 family peptidase [Phycisphaerae bacterium]|nr:S9 family peptidase [Phycisphaerae bacterium]